MRFDSGRLGRLRKASARTNDRFAGLRIVRRFM